MELIVPDEKLSLAIGKKGQNVRLASQLTGWSIDIHSESKVREMEARARQSLAAIKSGARWWWARGGRPSRRCFRQGWRSAAEVAAGKPDELASITGIGGADGRAGGHRGGGEGRRTRTGPSRRGGRARRPRRRRRSPRRPPPPPPPPRRATARRRPRDDGGDGDTSMAAAHPDLHRVPTAGCRGRDGAVRLRSGSERRTGRGRGRRIVVGTGRLASPAAGLSGHGAAAGCARARVQAAGDGSRTQRNCCNGSLIASRRKR